MVRYVNTCRDKRAGATCVGRQCLRCERYLRDWKCSIVPLSGGRSIARLIVGAYICGLPRRRLVALISSSHIHDGSNPGHATACWCGRNIPPPRRWACRCGAAHTAGVLLRVSCNRQDLRRSLQPARMETCTNIPTAKAAYVPCCRPLSKCEPTSC